MLRGFDKVPSKIPATSWCPVFIANILRPSKNEDDEDEERRRRKKTKKK